jgi:hypothetical protein
MPRKRSEKPASRKQTEQFAFIETELAKLWSLGRSKDHPARTVAPSKITKTATASENCRAASGSRSAHALVATGESAARSSTARG